MKPLSVVVAQRDAKTADFLAKSLYNHFRVVTTAGNLNELMYSIPKNRADVAIVDLELAGMEQVQQLRQQFSETTIVCTHRLADEKMWAEALAAGAADCCHASDVRAIVLAAANVRPMAHSHAA
ncbi:MAG TPA: response regulator [Candidatus Angelobacter sp.]